MIWVLWAAKSRRVIPKRYNNPEKEIGTSIYTAHARDRDNQGWFLFTLGSCFNPNRYFPIWIILTVSLRPSGKECESPGGAASENALQGGRDHHSLNPGAQHFALSSREGRCLFLGAQSAGPSAFRRLRRFAWGRPVSKRDVPGQACHTTSAACSPRYGFAVLNLAAIPPHICREESRQKCSGHPGSSPPLTLRPAGAEGAGCVPSNASGNTSGLITLHQPTASSIACHRPPHPATHSAGGHRLCLACGRCRFPFVATASWAVPAQAPEGVCPTHKLAVFAGGWEPEVSHPLYRQSPPG